MTNYQSNLILQNVPAKSGVYPQITVGQLVIPTSTTLLTNDLLQLFKLSAPGRLLDVWLDISGALETTSGTITLQLQDDAGTPLIYTATDGIVNGATNNTLAKIAQNGGVGFCALGATAGRFGSQLYTADATFSLLVALGGADATAAARTINFWALTRND